MNRRTFVSCLLALPGLRWLKPKAVGHSADCMYGKSRQPGLVCYICTCGFVENGPNFRVYHNWDDAGVFYFPPRGERRTQVMLDEAPTYKGVPIQWVESFDG